MLHIIAKRWFQKSYGNTYHSVRIIKDGEQLAYIPFSYGYGEQWLQTAWEWMQANGHTSLPYGGTLGLREDLHGTYEVHDVERKRDL